MLITIKPDFLIRTVAGESILIGAGEQIDFSRMLILNKTSVFLIRKLQEHTSITLDDLIKHLVNHYQVDYTEAYTDTLAVIHQLENLGVVTLAD